MITYVLVTVNQKWWHKPVTPALRRQTQDLYEFEASLPYTEHSKAPSMQNLLLVYVKTKCESNVG